MASTSRKHTFNLTYLNRFDIENKEKGLREPSGLALSQGGDSLWTISDDTKKIFKISLDGDLINNDSFAIHDKGLEGIVLDPAGENLLVVKEDSNEVIKICIETHEVIERQHLSAMANYDSIAAYFSRGGKNKGLEGITWNSNTGTFFVMKEAKPGLLIELCPDLLSIRDHRLLNEANGFIDHEVVADSIDFSDLCYDGSTDCFWIISDKARRLFMYDWTSNKVIQSCKLAYGKDGEYEQIEKAEGVVIDPDNHRLYIVSDEEARLYLFDLRA